MNGGVVFHRRPREPRRWCPTMFCWFALTLTGWLNGALAQSTLEDYALSIQPAADLRLATPAITANQIDAGSNATLTVSVTNLGPSTATGVTLVNRLSKI